MTLTEHAQNIRRNILDAGYKAGAMHFGGSLSLAEILSVLYGSVLRYDVKNPTWKERDRLILSKGHGGLALYAALYEFGLISHDDLFSVKSDGGDFTAQPKRNLNHCLEMSSGSLGLGLSFAIGQAIGVGKLGSGEVGKLRSGEVEKWGSGEVSNNRTIEQSNNLPQLYVIVGNGEINEGSFWEAAMFAGARGLANLCVTLDDNGLQLDGDSNKVLPVTNWGAKLASFGWMVTEVDGHDCEALLKAYQTPPQGRPLAVIAKTVKGKGVSFMENVGTWHHGKMTEEQYKQALVENGGAE